MNNRRKIVVITGIMIIFLIIAIAKAFEYLPEPQEYNSLTPQVNLLNGPNTEQNQTSEQKDDTSDNAEQNSQKQNFNIDLPKTYNIEEEIQPINEEDRISESGQNNQKQLSKAEETELKLLNAKNLKEEKQYDKALEEYKSILESTSDKKIMARCYEEIANIYATYRRYGSALSYAQKAYNLQPSSNREILLARLYYKTGDTEKAQAKINGILKREFAED